MGQLLITTKSVNHLLYWMNTVDVATVSGEQQEVVDQVLDMTEHKIKYHKPTLHMVSPERYHQSMKLCDGSWVNHQSFTRLVSPDIPFSFFSMSVASRLVGEGVVPPDPSSLTLVSSGFNFAAADSSNRHLGAIGRRTANASQPDETAKKAIPAC